MGHNAETLQRFIPTEIPNELVRNNLPYYVSEEEVESRRSSAQMKFKKGFGDYIDCVCSSDYKTAESYKQLREKCIYGFTSNIVKILTLYHYFIVLPKDHTFKKDLEAHTKKTRSGVKYTGSYKNYMKDYENFQTKTNMFGYTPEEIEITAKNFIRVVHLISRSLNRIKDAKPLEEFKNMYNPDLSENFWVEVYGNDDIIDEVKEAIKKACS